jgi:hypothetical protein
MQLQKSETQVERMVSLVHTTYITNNNFLNCPKKIIVRQLKSTTLNPKLSKTQVHAV